ncbi:MAG: hypothetical protein JWQ11_610 [Rhizobacter sp.]|nr:hypothetical protein [Rhizobacter sp.]
MKLAAEHIDMLASVPVEWAVIKRKSVRVSYWPLLKHCLIETREIVDAAGIPQLEWRLRPIYDDPVDVGSSTQSAGEKLFDIQRNSGLGALRKWTRISAGARDTYESLAKILPRLPRPPKSLAQVAYEAGPLDSTCWSHLSTTTRLYFESIAVAVEKEVLSRSLRS